MEKKYIWWRKGSSFIMGSLVFVGAFAAIFAAMLFKAYALGVLIFVLFLVLLWFIFERDRA